MRSKFDHTIFYLLALFIITIIAFSILIPNIFWSVSNFQSMASWNSSLRILTLTNGITMLTGGINLSIIASMNAPPFNYCLFYYKHAGISWLFLSVIKLFMCINYWGDQWHTDCYYPSFTDLTTLGTMTLINGINILVTNGSTVAGFK